MEQGAGNMVYMLPAPCYMLPATDNLFFEGFLS